QYFTLPHIIHVDSSGFHWIKRIFFCIPLALDSTGLHYILDHYNNNHKSGLGWTPLDCQLYSTQNWTPLDWTGLDWTLQALAYINGR
ncbi:hypothetical protein K443DRAFT_117127, partial [Laccaria amethystina LaAM-08-1]